MEWLAKRLYIANKSLPGDFFARLTDCDKNCRACSYCQDLCREHARTIPLALPDLRPPHHI